MGIVISRTFVAAVLAASGPAAAWAQAFNAIGPKGPAEATPKVTPPPALPGAAPSGNRVPSSRPANDLEPTEALFDAINRGDIGAARDAISRGADLNGRNILDMTPMELSVDLGRNDISFLLLSMRGADDGRTRSATAAAGKPASPAAGKQAARSAGTKARSARATEVPPGRPGQQAGQQRAQQTARLFSGDGGTPIPNAGFLGFDNGRR
jgi:hypothetical protein